MKEGLMSSVQPEKTEIVPDGMLNRKDYQNDSEYHRALHNKNLSTFTGVRKGAYYVRGQKVYDLRNGPKR